MYLKQDRMGYKEFQAVQAAFMTIQMKEQRFLKAKASGDQAETDLTWKEYTSTVEDRYTKVKDYEWKIFGGQNLVKYAKTVLDSGEGTEYATALIMTDLVKWRTMLFGILSKNDLVTRRKFTKQTSEVLT